MPSNRGKADRLTDAQALRWAYVMAFRSHRSVRQLGLDYFGHDNETLDRIRARLGIVDGEASASGEMAAELERMRNGQSEVVMLPDIAITRPGSWLSCASEDRGAFLVRGLGSLQVYNVFGRGEDQAADSVDVDEHRRVRLTGVLRTGKGTGPTNQDAGLDAATEYLRKHDPGLGLTESQRFGVPNWLLSTDRMGNRFIIHAVAPRFVGVIGGEVEPGLTVSVHGNVLHDFRFIDAATIRQVAEVAREAPEWLYAR